MEQIIRNINMFFEYFTFFYVIFRRPYRKPSKKRIVAIVGHILFWIGTTFVGFDWQMSILGPASVFFIWICILLWLIFECSITEIIVLGIGQWQIVSMMETTLYIMLQQLQLEEYILENIITLLVACIFWIVYILGRKRHNVRVFKLPIKMWCLLDIIMLILTAMMTFFTYVVTQNLPNSKAMFMGRLLMAFGGMVIFILLFVMLYFYNTTYDFRRQKELADMYNKQQREYFLLLLQREEETRSFRHDIINDLLEMHNYCVNKNCNQMENYLKSTLGVVQKISKSSYDVGNDIVNTILNYYLKPLKEKCSIEITGYMSEQLPIEERDLCILSANLIKNASEAVDKMENGKIWITINEGKKYLYIEVKNTFEGKIKLDKKGMPITTKFDVKNHGIGTYNIADIVKKNGGTYDVESIDGVYKVKIYLKI